MDSASWTGKLLASLPVLLFFSSAQAEIEHYSGICDASAAIALDDERFVVADDEVNILRIYRRGQPEWESATIDLNPLLGTDPGDESDIEAMARIGDRLYMITSHAHNSKGAPKKKRLRFFAADLNVVDGQRTLVPTGTAYRKLREDLVNNAGLEQFNLADTVKEGQKPEDAGGFSIEGLAATPDGGLLIGFRNPLVRKSDRSSNAQENDRALLVPLRNPAGVLSGQDPDIGEPVTLPLGGRGIRSIELDDHNLDDHHFVIVAGPVGSDGEFAIFNWWSDSSNERVEQTNVEVPKDFRPEAIFAWPNGEITLLSDDGDMEVGSESCKELKDDKRRGFRAWTQ